MADDAAPAENPRAELGRERRRQMQVRQSLIGALDRATPGDPALAELEEAALAYMMFSMPRLDLTDMGIHDLLRARVPADNREVHDGLAALDERQAKARAATAAADMALTAYRDGGRANFTVFDAAVRDYVQVMQSLMTPRKNPYGPYTDKLFTMDDWAAIAQVTGDTVATEKKLFDTVCAAAPEDLAPDGFSGTHGLKPSHVKGPQ